MHCLIAYKNPKADNAYCRHQGLGITANNLSECLNDAGIPTTVIAVAGGESIWNMLDTHGDMTHVVLCAPYFDTPFLEKLCRNFPHVQFTVTYHSNWGFLQVDNFSTASLMKHMDLQQRIRNFKVSGNCPEFTESLQPAFRVSGTLLPNLYYQHGAIDRTRQPWDGGDLHIGIFGAIRTLKNLLTAVVAARAIGNSVKAQRTFAHVSTERVEHGEGILTNLKTVSAGAPNFELVQAPWMQWPDFQIYVRKMRLLLQPSYTETFNNVTADGITQGVPSVVGYPIGWVPDNWRACPDDAREIAATGVALLNSKTAAVDGWESLKAHNRSGIAHWRKWLGC